MFVARSCAHFRSFGVHNNMNVESVIEKLQQITRENEVQRSEHRQKQEEKAKLLKKIAIKEELRRAKKGMNIQPLVIRSPPHSSSSLKCVEGKVYNEKISLRKQ